MQDIPSTGVLDALTDAAERGDYEQFHDLLHVATKRKLGVPVRKLYASATCYSERHDAAFGGSGISVEGKRRIVGELQGLGQISAPEAERALLELTRRSVYQSSKTDPVERALVGTDNTFTPLASMILQCGADPQRHISSGARTQKQHANVTNVDRRQLDGDSPGPGGQRPELKESSAELAATGRHAGLVDLFGKLNATVAPRQS